MLRDGQLPAQTQHSTAQHTTSSSSASEHVTLILTTSPQTTHVHAAANVFCCLHMQTAPSAPKQLMPQHCDARNSYSCNSCYKIARAAPAASASVAPALMLLGCLTPLRWGSCSQHHQSHQTLRHCSSSSSNSPSNHQQGDQRCERADEEWQYAQGLSSAEGIMVLVCCCSGKTESRSSKTHWSVTKHVANLASCC
jgi:hypothetical protein